MSRVYDSLRGMMQDTLQKGKTSSVPLARVKGSDAMSLNDEMEELERILADGIGRLRTAVKKNEALVADEAQRTEQLVESLRGNIGMLEARLRDMEDNVRRKESARQKLGESLTDKIQDLQKDVKKKEELLETQTNQVNALKSNIDGQAKRVAELELALEKVKMEAASHAKRAEDLSESSQAKIVALEAQLRDTEELVGKKESTLKGLEQNLTAKAQDFETQMRNKEELLAGRDAEVNDLKTQLKLLTKGIEEMSSFFRQAEALAAIERQDGSTAVLTEPLKPTVPDSAREIVSPDLFHRITGELAEVTGVMEPIASIIVRDHVAALGESMEKFPKTRFPELLESLSKEILDENLKMDFRKGLAQNA